jgi:hypothetical protein
MRLASAIGLTLLAISCTRRDQQAFWQPGAVYSLRLETSETPHLMPEILAKRSPLSDTVVFSLVVDSVAGDSVFGRHRGDSFHFWPLSRGADDTTFVATRNREHWYIDLDPHARDAGVDLSGELSHDRVTGAWATRGPVAFRGTFIAARAPNDR